MPFPKGNDYRALEASHRISMAVLRLMAKGQPLKQISDWVKALVQEARVSTRTLYKHLDLWHPDHFSEACKKDHLASHAALFGQDFTVHLPPPPKKPEPLIMNPFLHLGESMKSVAVKSPAKKYLSPRDEWGCGGEKGLSTGLEGV